MSRLRLLPLGIVLLVSGGVAACSKSTTSSVEQDPDEGKPGTKAGDSIEAPTPAPPTLRAAEDILERAAEAMGGREALEEIHRFYYRGTVELTGQNIRGDLEIWWKEGDFFMEQTIPGIGQMRAGKRGNEIWSEDPINGLRRLSGVEAEQHAWASSLLLAAEWKRYFDSATTIAERELRGRPVYDVKLTAASGLTVTMSFDRESGLQVAQSFEQISPMGRQPFEIYFEDYRTVEGIQLAYRQVIDAKVQQMVQTITEVKLNAEVDERRFGFPHRGDVVKAPAP